MATFKLPALLPPTIDLKTLDLKDKAIQDAIIIYAKEWKYNQELVQSLNMMYTWQRRAIAYTKDSLVTGIISGNQVGKSMTACAAAACHLTGLYPSWWKGAKYDRPVTVVMAGVDSSHNKNVLQQKLFGTNNKRMKEEVGSGMLPQESIVTKSIVTNRGDDIQSCRIKHSSGGLSEVIFRAYSQGREAAQGFSADVIVIDEQPQDEFWSECLTRLATTGGHVMCSFTPLKGLTGLVEELLSLPEDKASPEDKFGHKYKSGDGWSMVRASWEDITHIDAETKLRLAKGYASYEADARMFGVPIAGHGRVFPYNTGEISYLDNEVQIRPEWDHLIGIDIGHGHGNDPSAVLLAAWDQKNDIVYITEESYGQTETTRQMARLITGINHTVPVVWPADASKTSMNSPASVVDQLRDMQLNMTSKCYVNPRGADGKRNVFKMTMINHINGRFAEGKMVISSNCTNLLREFEQYQYDKNGKIVDGNDHCLDAMRYVVGTLIQGFGSPLNDDYTFDTEDDDDFDWNPY